jgi:hypothetical protein
MTKLSAAEILIEAAKNYNPTPEERELQKQRILKILKDSDDEFKRKQLDERKHFHEILNKPYLI